MRIALDAHTIGSRVGGNETYIANLITALQKIDSKNQYLLYATNPDALNGALRQKPANFSARKLWPKQPFFRIPFATPWRLYQDQADIALFQFIAPPVAGGKYILAIHDIIYEHYPEYFKAPEMLRLKLTTPYAAKRAAHIVTCSQSSKNDLIKFYGINPDKISVVYLGRNENFKAIKDAESLQKVRAKYNTSNQFILYVGNIQPRKNLSRLIEAFARLKENKTVPHKLVITGNPAWLYSEVFQSVRHSGLESDIVLTGYVPDQDLPALYSAADIFVYPSIFEGFGIPVLEAMACGVPVVTSKTSSLPEVAGDAALLVDPLSVDSILDGIKQVLHGGDLRVKLREKGFRQAEKFSWDVTAQQMLALFEKVHAK